MSESSGKRGIAKLEIPYIEPLPTAPLRLHVEIQLTVIQARALRAIEEGLFHDPPRLATGHLVRSGADTVRYLLERVAVAAGLYTPPAPTPLPEPEPEPANALPPPTDRAEPMEPEPARPDPTLCKDCQERPIQVLYTSQCRQCHTADVDRDIATQKAKPSGPAQGPKRRRKARMTNRAPVQRVAPP